MPEIGKLQLKQLHGRLAKTKQFSYLDQLKDYFIECLNSGNVSMPTLTYLFSAYPKYREDMIRLYNGTFSLYDGVESIPDDLKASQGAVMDGLCYFYDISGSGLGGICTLNMDCLGLDPVLDTKVLDKVFKVNQMGTVHSLRIDFSYKDYDPNSIEYKTVAHKAVIDDAEKVYLIPYAAGYVLCSLIKSLLNQGGILGVKQTLPNNEVKIRCLTTNRKHIEHYLEGFVIDDYALETEFYPLKAKFYAPVLGAPITTLMKTKTDLFNLDSIVRIKSYAQCKSLGVQKISDPIENLLKEQSVLSTIANMKVNNSDEFFRTIPKLRDVGVTTNMLNGDIDVPTLSNYFHTATQGALNKALKVVPGAEAAYKARRSLLSDEPRMRSVGNPMSEFRDIIKSNIVKVIWKKPDGMYTSAIVTNSRQILQKIYGNNYFGTYESIGVRTRCAAEDVLYTGMPVDEAVKAYGLDETRVQEIKDKIESGSSIEDSFYEGLGVKRRASVSDETIVTCRSISGYLSKDISKGSSMPRANDYYVSVDTKHIVSCNILI